MNGGGSTRDARNSEAVISEDHDSKIRNCPTPRDFEWATNRDEIRTIDLSTRGTGGA